MLWYVALSDFTGYEEIEERSRYEMSLCPLFQGLTMRQLDKYSGTEVDLEENVFRGLCRFP